MDIPPPPPPPPSGDIPPPYGIWPPGVQPADAAPVDAQPAGARPAELPPADAHSAGPPPPPPPPPPSGAGSPYGAGPPYGPPPPYPQGPYGQQQPPYGPGPGAPTPYPGLPPYGAPGPYGYPAQPQGWYAERPTNGLAIASLVTALTCIPLLGLILGLFGLRQIRRRGDRGKGLAVAGVTINSLWTLLAAAITVLALVGVVTQGNTRVRDLTAGDCFNTVHSSLSDYGGGGTPSTTVDVVSCDTAHDAEAYKVFALDPGPGGGYPGAAAIAETASAQCATYADDYLGGSQRPSGLHIYYFMPPADGWYRGDQNVICFFGSPSGKVTGSAKTGGNASGVGV